MLTESFQCVDSTVQKIRLVYNRRSRSQKTLHHVTAAHADAIFFISVDSVTQLRVLTSDRSSLYVLCFISHHLSFIPDFKPSILQILPTAAFLFPLQDWLSLRDSPDFYCHS